MARSKLFLLVLAFVCFAQLSQAFDSHSELTMAEIHDIGNPPFSFLLFTHKEISNQQKAEELASM